VGGFVESQIIIARRYASRYGEIEVLNRRSAFAGEEIGGSGDSHVNVRLRRDEVDLQRVVTRREARSGSAGSRLQLSIAGHVYSDGHGRSGVARILRARAVNYCETICEHLAIYVLASDETRAE